MKREAIEVAAVVFQVRGNKGWMDAEMREEEEHVEQKYQDCQVGN